MRHYINLVEQSQKVPTLYHGTCQDSADALLQNGWEPNVWPRGGNSGDPNYLYLSTDSEDAMWFANEKDCDVVIAVVDVPLDYLEVDPDDGTHDTVEAELSGHLGLPGKVVLIKRLSAQHFRSV